MKRYLVTSQGDMMEHEGGRWCLIEDVEKLAADLEKEKRLHKQTEAMRLDHLRLGNARFAKIERLEALLDAVFNAAGMPACHCEEVWELISDYRKAEAV